MKSIDHNHPEFLFAPGWCVLVVAAAFAGCSPSPVGASKTEPLRVPVLVAKAELRDVPVEIHAVGNIQAYSAVAVRSQITGPIVSVHFEEGREVKAGDLLFTIDPRPFEAALSQARANVKRDEARLLSARLDFERTSNLFQMKIASQQDYDTVHAAFSAAQSTVIADDAAVTNALTSLSYTEIRSPMDARTGDLKVKAGNVVKAPDDVLVNLAQIHPIYAAFSVPERNLPAIQRRMREATLPVTAMISGVEKNPRGELTFVNNAVDMNTGTILLKAAFANDDNALWPGQFVQVSLALSNLVQATVVPAQAVQMGQNGEYVFVAKPDETVELRPVKSFITQDGMTVILGGVQPGESVVTDGQLRLTPGAKISVKPVDTFAAATNTAASLGNK